MIKSRKVKIKNSNIIAKDNNGNIYNKKQFTVIKKGNLFYAKITGNKELANIYIK